VAEITAATVKALREQTNLPMMECKRALEEANGDAALAVDLLRKKGKVKMADRATSGRETAFGRVATFADFAAGQGAIVDLRCESAPVANHEEFIQLANDMVQQLATGPGASTPEELLAQPSPSKPGHKLSEQFEDLNNRIREVFKAARIARVKGQCGVYTHHNGLLGVLLQVEGGNGELAKEICMHIAFANPSALVREELDPALVAKERELQTERARAEGKPDKVIEKMIEGRMKDFYASQCLVDQPFVKDPNQTVGQVAKAGNMKLVRFIRWEIGKE
jgi:elongation factor Ts